MWQAAFDREVAVSCVQNLLLILDKICCEDYKTSWSFLTVDSDSEGDWYGGRWVIKLNVSENYTRFFYTDGLYVVEVLISFCFFREVFWQYSCVSGQALLSMVSWSTPNCFFSSYVVFHFLFSFYNGRAGSTKSERCESNRITPTIGSDDSFVFVEDGRKSVGDNLDSRWQSGEVVRI